MPCGAHRGVRIRALGEGGGEGHILLVGRHKLMTKRGIPRGIDIKMQGAALVGIV